MKRFVLFSCVIANVLFLSGCYINKKGNICSVTMPAVYCDDELYEQMTKPGQMVDRWAPGGRTVQVRLQDWLECGGNSWGSYSLSPLPNGEQRTTLQYNADGAIKAYSIQRCMMKKSYEYIGQCETSVSRKFPPCRARAGEPWE